MHWANETKLYFIETLKILFTSVRYFYNFNVYFWLISDMSLSVTFKHKNVTLTPNKENVIASPGYPNEKYECDTIYTWDVTAPPTTEIIFINVNINIHKFLGPCEDYLKVCITLIWKKWKIIVLQIILNIYSKQKTTYIYGIKHISMYLINNILKKEPKNPVYLMSFWNHSKMKKKSEDKSY